MRATFLIGLLWIFSSFQTEHSYVLYDIQFDLNSDKLNESKLDELKKVITTIREALAEGRDTTFTLWINGNADTSETNPKKLSTHRANIVYENLRKLGLNEGEFIVKGFGAKRPIASSATESGRKRNARVDFKINTR